MRSRGRHLWRGGGRSHPSRSGGLGVTAQVEAVGWPEFRAVSGYGDQAGSALSF